MSTGYRPLDVVEGESEDSLPIVKDMDKARQWNKTYQKSLFFEKFGRKFPVCLKDDSRIIGAKSW